MSKYVEVRNNLLPAWPIRYALYGGDVGRHVVITSFVAVMHMGREQAPCAAAAVISHAAAMPVKRRAVKPHLRRTEMA